MRKVVMSLLVVSLFFSGLCFMGKQAMATIDVMANRQLVILADTQLLDDYRKPNSIVGSISGMQMVEIACGFQDSKCLAKTGDIEYIQIKTWMGDKWIKDDDKITAGGYWETDRVITIVEDMKLYDQPNAGIYTKDTPPVETITPQKVHVTAKYQDLYKGAHTARSMFEAPKWYRISTEEGEKWIENPFIPEDYQKIEIPSDRIIKLTGSETLYDYPHEIAGKGIQAKQGVVQAVAYCFYAVPIQNDVWYKIQTDDGTLKWVRAFPISENESGPLMAFNLANEKITLRTATRYFDIDGDASRSLQNWLQPGSYVADKINNGWARVQTPFGWKVVNLDRAPLERPQGITEAKELVKLTPDTITYYFPLAGEILHGAGTFNDQEALSFEKWISPQGIAWYHISTYSGIVWVPEKPITQD
ncbi:hypothetical protein GQF01_13090 [Paenibacillus sp. 5J-6]|uniref:Uncharacterized protein n=1 Tax=Paenibacillus silvestris TaxID=2606219 RepID=A0A6L8V021_9BACL|nr:hypothetical protein [Paenibacillus silvestris]MZQ83042.1 hypothetical protein [Paenibacillus silvestris]